MNYQTMTITATLALAAVAPLHAAPRVNQQATVSCTEGFENVAQLTSRGWIILNRSDPLGTTSWFQGVPARFPSQAGPNDSYASADVLNASGQFPVLSDWLITPDIQFPSGGDSGSLSFYTRELASATDEANHLEVLLCIDGGSQPCTDPGPESGDVGGFQTALVDINANAVAGGYPASWTLYTAIVAGAATPTGSGRIAFHYYDLAQRMDPIGTTIGIDSFSLFDFPICPFPDVIFANGFESR